MNNSESLNQAITLLKELRDTTPMVAQRKRIDSFLGDVCGTGGASQPSEAAFRDDNPASPTNQTLNREVELLTRKERTFAEKNPALSGIKYSSDTLNRELLPCPFCGGEAQHQTSNFQGKEFHTLLCDSMECAINPDTCTAEDYVKVKAAWNNRVSPSEIRLQEDFVTYASNSLRECIKYQKDTYNSDLLQTQKVDVLLNALLSYTENQPKRESQGEISGNEDYAAAMYEIGEIVRVARDNPDGLREFLMLNYPKEWGITKMEHKQILSGNTPKREASEIWLTVGEFSIRDVSPDKVHISHISGEGGEFNKAGLAQAIKDFYDKNF